VMYIHLYIRILDPVPVMRTMRECVWARLDRRWKVKGGGELIYRKKSAGNIS